MGWQHTFRISGDRFLPSKVPFAFTEAWDPHTKVVRRGAFNGLPASYGYASYTVPASVDVLRRIEFLANTFVPLLPALRDSGADDWQVWITRFYHGQCNEEYRAEEIAAMARLGCAICYSAEAVSEEEVRMFCIENGYPV